MSADNICTIIISIMASIIAAYCTAKSSNEAFEKQNNKDDIKKAIELARRYEHEMLPLLSAVNSVYRKRPNFDKLQGKLNSERQVKDLQFTSAEMHTLFNQEEIDQALSSIDINKMDTSSLLNSRIIINKSYLNDQMFLSSQKLEGEEKEKFDSMFKKQLEIEFKSAKETLLNKLESFAMYFSNGIADEKIVYQSLHQTFISTILLLYFDIAKINTDPKDTFYINIVELFKIWNTRYMEKKKQEEEVQAATHDHITEKPGKYKK